MPGMGVYWRRSPEAEDGAPANAMENQLIDESDPLAESPPTRSRPQLLGLIMPGKTSGGVRQWAESILNDLRSAGYEVCVFTQEPGEEAGLGGKSRIYPGPRMRSGVARFVRYLTLAMGRQDADGREFAARVRSLGVRLLIYPTPVACLPPRDIPFVVCIPDLMHRYYPQLPEYRWPKTVARDIVYGRYARDAKVVVVDAESGAGDVERFLGVARTKCRVVPYRPPPSIMAHRGMSVEAARRATARFDLPPRFLFYPAQLWAHKNHGRLIEALGLLKREQGWEVPLVCAGFTDGRFAVQAEKLRVFADRLGVAGQIRFTGYVSTEQLAGLYRLARALVFPSLLGPTNIPPLEAMVMGTPVLCSNLFGMPEQMGDAGILFDPFDPRAIADAIATIWENDRRCADLAARGQARLMALERVDSANLWRNVVLSTRARAVA